MRHGKKINHLGRKAAHRQALLSNMATSLIMNKRITTTVAKAKALRKYVEPLLTKSKDDSTNSRRVVFSYLQNKESVTELFGSVASRISDRPGGYTRIIRTGNRLGDNADMCIMELVDFNDLYGKETTAKKAKTTRRGRKSGKKAEDGAVEASAVQEEASEAAQEKPAKKKAAKKKKSEDEA